MSFVDRIRSRKWPIITAVLMVAVGMAFMFGWNPVVHHTGNWATGNDLWGIFRAAHYVGWGYLGGVYTPSNGVIAFPGMSVILAPVAMLSGHFHLTESDPLMVVARPTAALLLQPVELLLASSVVFATDALAERLNVLKGRRAQLCVLVGIIAWPVAAVWGHAEDVLAVTFAVYALLALIDGKWARCGWLLGVGIAIQPLVLLLVPLALGASPSGRRVALALRSAALSVVLVGVAFIGDRADTFRALVKQPTPPSVNHATPWIAWAPQLNSGALHTVHTSYFVPHLHSHPTVEVVTSRVPQVIFVAGGPGRLIDMVLALVVGVYIWRRPQTHQQLLWLAAAVLASRCFFEAVMTPYYLAPPLTLGLVMASRQGGKRFWAAAVISLEITVFAYYHLNPWVWWLPLVVGLAVVLALGYPGLSSAEVDPPRSTEFGVEHSDPVEEPTPVLELPASPDHELQPVS